MYKIIRRTVVILLILLTFGMAFIPLLIFCDSGEEFKRSFKEVYWGD